MGHPKDKFDALVERIQTGVKTFQEIEGDFLDLIWTYDTYRIEQVVPRGMGKADLTPDKRLQGIYRGKGNCFSTVVAQIVGQRTTSQLASRSDVQGFSQTHQVDIAWPARDVTPIVDPLICCEAKLTGAPGYPGNEQGRGPTDDWSNRRKELKFQATDLKLYRQAANTRINNWDVWRKKAAPRVYSIWAARVGEPKDISYMVKAAQDLGATYLDGVGIYAFEPNSGGTGYTPSGISKGVSERVTSLDNVLGMIAAEIQEIIDENGGNVPEPVRAPASG